MGMLIEKRFTVRSPAAAVWKFLIDPASVARCLPGAAVTGQAEDGSWLGTMTVKVGPVTASYRGKLRFDRLDEAAGEADLSASGQETRGKGGADLKMSSRVAALSAEETEVVVRSDVNVFGLLAQMGRGMIQDVSDQMFAKFSAAMRQELESAAAVPAATAPVPANAIAIPAAVASLSNASAAPAVPAREDVLDVGALGAAAAGRAAGRLLRRPTFWIIVVLATLLLLCRLH